MSQRRYHRRSKMKRRLVQNGSHNGSKMAPEWLQHGSKMAPWRPLGGPWARPCCQTLPGGVPERLWHGPGRPKKFILAALERPWSEKWIDFGLLEGPREGPGGGSGRSFWELWGGCTGGNEKKQKSHTKVCFLRLFFFACIFLTAPVCVLFASALAGAKAQLKNMLNTIGFYDIICVCAVCARSANILQTERKSNKKLSNCKRKNTMPRKLEKKTKKARFWEPTCLQKSTPEASGSALDASCARLPRQELSESALGGLQERKKVPRAPLGEISNEIDKQLASGRTRAGLGRRRWRSP